MQGGDGHVDVGTVGDGPQALVIPLAGCLMSSGGEENGEPQRVGRGAFLACAPFAGDFDNPSFLWYIFQ